jgi:Kdo2-lipid IVA lauroyltransferase/acyltransferase
MTLRNSLKSKIKTTRYLLEAGMVKFGLWFFYAIGVKSASNIAAKLTTFIGKRISVNKLAYKNLTKAIPNLTENEKEKVIDDMWDNLGRVIAEYPYVAHYPLEKMEEILEFSDELIQNIETIKNSGKGSIIFSGHIGNWEIGPKVFKKFGLVVHTVYRPLNNPYVEKMTAAIRDINMITKSTQGNRRIVEVIKNGGHILIMADQKISEGEPIKFFHDTAITTTSIAKIALKYDVPVVPARSIRIGKEFKFRVEVEKPLEIQKSNNLNSDIVNLTLEINRKLETWIRQYPAQWFWVHNRWKK